VVKLSVINLTISQLLALLWRGNSNKKHHRNELHCIARTNRRSHTHYSSPTTYSRWTRSYFWTCTWT